MSERIRGSYDDALYKSTYTSLTLLTGFRSDFSCNFFAIEKFTVDGSLTCMESGFAEGLLIG